MNEKCKSIFVQYLIYDRRKGKWLSTTFGYFYNIFFSLLTFDKRRRSRGRRIGRHRFENAKCNMNHSQWILNSSYQRPNGEKEKKTSAATHFR